MTRQEPAPAPQQVQPASTATGPLVGVCNFGLKAGLVGTLQLKAVAPRRLRRNLGLKAGLVGTLQLKAVSRFSLDQACVSIA